MAILTLAELQRRHGELWKIWRTPHGGVWLARRRDLQLVKDATAQRIKGLDLTLVSYKPYELLAAIEEQDRILGRREKIMTVDELAEEFGDDWYLNYSERSDLWSASLKADRDVRVQAVTGDGLATQLRARLKAWKDLTP